MRKGRRLVPLLLASISLLIFTSPFSPVWAQPVGDAVSAGVTRIGGSPAQPSSGAKDCGQYSDTGFQPGMSDASKAALECFYQAYPQCTPALLSTFQLSTYIVRGNFTLQGGSGGCSVAVEFLAFQRAVPEDQSEPKTFEEAGSCTQLNRSDGGGLRLSGCTGIRDFSLP